MKHLTTILDKVATELAARGLIKLAAELDIVANTLDEAQEPPSTAVRLAPGEVFQRLGRSIVKTAALDTRRDPALEGAVFTGHSINPMRGNTVQWKDAVSTDIFYVTTGGAFHIEMKEHGNDPYHSTLLDLSTFSGSASNLRSPYSGITIQIKDGKVLNRDDLPR